MPMLDNPRLQKELGPLAYRVLACDGDGTLTTKKKLARETEQALERWRKSGRQLVLATGETEEELRGFPGLSHFDLVVAENGAVLYWPSTKASRVLSTRKPDVLAERLKAMKVEPLTVGKVIISTELDNAETLKRVLHEHAPAWTIIRNRNEIMALPRGIDKSTGMCVALEDLGVSRSEAVGIGDAENDAALLQCCGLGVAVENAVLELKNCANLVIEGGSGVGVVRLIDRLLEGND